MRNLGAEQAESPLRGHPAGLQAGKKSGEFPLGAVSERTADSKIMKTASRFGKLFSFDVALYRDNQMIGIWTGAIFDRNPAFSIGVPDL